MVKNMPEPSEIDIILFEVGLSPRSNSAATAPNTHSFFRSDLQHIKIQRNWFLGIDVLSHPRLSLHVMDPTLAERGAKGQRVVSALKYRRWPALLAHRH